MAITNYPVAMQRLLQEFMLERETEEGLDSVLAFRMLMNVEMIPTGIGETLTKTRKGRRAPITNPLDIPSKTGLDSGITPTSDVPIEQYTHTLYQYAAAVDVDLMQDTTTIARIFTMQARNNAVQSGQSLERLARNAIFDAYIGGSTRVLASPSPTNIAAHVDDVRGFLQVMVNGRLTAISVTNPITAVEYGASGAVRTLTITSVNIDGGGGVSTAPGGISGTLNYIASPDAAPLAGNAIVATNAPAVLRSFARLTTADLQASDIFTFGLVQDAEAYLRDNGVPAKQDGTYHCILDNTSMRQLFGDPQFMTLFAGRDQSAEYRDGQVISLVGVTFIPTTETFVTSMTNASGVPIRVRRPILLGEESAIQGNFQGLVSFLSNIGIDNLSGEVALVDGVLHIAREPLSRLKDDVSLAWTWVGSFAIPTDATAITSIIPTASSAMYKRAVVMEHVG